MLGILNKFMCVWGGVKRKSNKGFTLSEVLITLVIIGVVAAITVPTLTANYTEQETISRVKKAHSVLANGLTMVKTRGGDIDYVIDGTDSNMNNMKEWFQTYYAPFVTTKVCYYTKGCWHDGYIKKMNGLDQTVQGGTWGLGNGTVMFVLNDGTMVSLDDSSTSQINSIFGVDIPTDSGTTYTMTMWFDINGLKKPNVIGRDIFAVVYDPTRGLVPAFTDRTKAQIERDCSSSGSGVACIQKYLKK